MKDKLMRLPKLLPPLALAPMLISIVSCGTQDHPKSTLTPPLRSTATQISTSGINPVCASLTIVQASRMDTDGTKSQVAANNAVISAVCGK